MFSSGYRTYGKPRFGAPFRDSKFWSTLNLAYRFLRISFILWVAMCALLTAYWSYIRACPCPNDEMGPPVYNVEVLNNMLKYIHWQTNRTTAWWTSSHGHDDAVIDALMVRMLTNIEQVKPVICGTGDPSLRLASATEEAHPAGKDKRSTSEDNSETSPYSYEPSTEVVAPKEQPSSLLLQQLLQYPVSQKDTVSLSRYLYSSSTDPQLPPIYPINNPIGRMYIVVGVECSGTGYIMKMLSNIDCRSEVEPNSGYYTMWDGADGLSSVNGIKLLEDKPKCAAIRRTFPQSDRWSDLRELMFTIASLGYEPKLLIAERSLYSTIKCQITNGISPNEAEATSKILYSMRLIYGHTATTRIPYIPISYETLSEGKSLRWLYAKLGHPREEFPKDHTPFDYENPTHEL